MHEIGVRIVDGQLKPGETLPDNGFVGEAEVSRTVVREAIKVLAAKGLVESRPKVGTRVRPRRDWNLLDPDVLAWQLEAGPTREFLQDALELRQLIEPAAARLAAGRATDEEIAALQEAFTAMCEARDLEASIDADVRFHSILLQAAHNELLEHLSSIVTAVLRMLFAFSSRPPRTFTRALPLHEAIIEAVQSHDPDAAEAAALRLLDDTAKNIKRALHEVSRLQASSSADGRRRVRDGSRT